MKDKERHDIFTYKSSLNLLQSSTKSFEHVSQMIQYKNQFTNLRVGPKFENKSIMRP